MTNRYHEESLNFANRQVMSLDKKNKQKTYNDQFPTVKSGNGNK